MTMITILGMRDPVPPGVTVVDTTSRSRTWSRGLSPFILGPCELWGGHVSLTMENAWQYSKVYSEHAAPSNYLPSSEWLVWAQAGWANPRAVRYPMGKGRRPLYSWWAGKAYDYVEARRWIYIPVYWRAVERTYAFGRLLALTCTSQHIALLDFDGYDWRRAGLSCVEAVVDCSVRKMGHAFVLAMMLKDRGIE